MILLDEILILNSMLGKNLLQFLSANISMADRFCFVYSIPNEMCIEI